MVIDLFLAIKIISYYDLSITPQIVSNRANKPTHRFKFEFTLSITCTDNIMRIVVITTAKYRTAVVKLFLSRSLGT